MAYDEAAAQAIRENNQLQNKIADLDFRNAKLEKLLRYAASEMKHFAILDRSVRRIEAEMEKEWDEE